MATYLDNAGVTQILTKIKALLAKKAEITAIPTKVSELTNDSLYQNAAEVIAKIDTKLGGLSLDDGGNDTHFVYSVKQKNGQISVSSASFSESFTKQLESAHTTGSVVSRTDVNTAINSAVGKITSFEYKIVDYLPPESDGEKGTIYLLRRTGKDYTNLFDEYILVDTFTGTDGSVYSAHYEKIGTTDIDLTPYAKKTEIPTKVSQLTNDSDFETKANVGSRITEAINGLDKADTAVEGKYVSAVSETNGVITVTRASLPAVGTADSPISNATIESIFTQVFG